MTASLGASELLRDREEGAPADLRYRAPGGNRAAHARGVLQQIIKS
jgi:hypothetical protein